MSLFERPHRSMSASDVVMGLKPEALREVDDYAVWLDKVRAELVAVYGEQGSRAALADISYATSDEPTHFSSRVTEGLFERLRQYKSILTRIEETNTLIDEQGKSRQLAEAELAAAEEAGRGMRLRQRELRAVNAKMTQLRREQESLDYERACLCQQLSNVFKAELIRVSFA